MLSTLIIACILLYRMVSSYLQESRALFVLSCTLGFRLKKKDFKIAVSWLPIHGEIEFDVHLKWYLCFLICNIPIPGLCFQVTRLMNNADNLITKLFLAKNFFSQWKIYWSSFYTKHCTAWSRPFQCEVCFFSFCLGKIKSSLQCKTEPSLLWLTPLMQLEITEVHTYIHTLFEQVRRGSQRLMLTY